MPNVHNKKIVPLAKTLRKNMTKEERRLWYDFLKTFPVKFVRQKVLGNYIADFYSFRLRLVIELDGSEHYSDLGEQKDAERTDNLMQMGISVIRFTNLEVQTNFRGVCEKIYEIAKEKDVLPD